MSEIKLEHILTHADDRLAISHWEMIFADKELPYRYNYPYNTYAFYSIINGRIHMHDADDYLISEFSTSIDEIQSLLIYVNKIFCNYQCINNRDIPWQKIGREAFSLMRKVEMENGKALQELISLRKCIAQDFSSKEIPEVLHNVMSGSQWIENAKFYSNPIPLYDNIWFDKEICLFFADSNIGKSILAIQIACEIALQRRVVYFDYEMSAPAFAHRFGGLFNKFPILKQNFLRCQPEPDLFLCDNSFNHILADISAIVRKHQADVIVIDNISLINSNINTSARSAKLMYILNKIASELSVSILIIAHTAKRCLSRPISQKDLAGSLFLFNFADSVFAIGQSLASSDTQYLKHLKSRSAKITYGPDNVILLRRVFSDGYLHFEKIGHGREANLLNPPTSAVTTMLHNIILNLEKEGLPQSKIAQILNISQAKVSRLKNQVH